MKGGFRITLELDPGVREPSEQEIAILKQIEAPFSPLDAVALDRTLSGT